MKCIKWEVIEIEMRISPTISRDESEKGLNAFLLI